MMDSSEQYFEKAQEKIPGGVSSPVRSFKHVGGNPIYFSKARGCEVFDVRGRRYTDFCLSFGPHLLGHSDPDVVAAIKDQAEKATSFGACHPGELEMAELILRGYPFLDQVRLVNSGTEAVMTAVRLARGATGREKVIVFDGCYHGHSDGLLAKAGSGVAAFCESSSQGVPKSVVADTLVLPYGDADALQQAFAAYPNQIAAVLLEPIPANYGLRLTERGELSSLVNVARAQGALVIFDEVITGFRIGFSGASGYFDLQPDLVTLGKVIGGGMPLAAVAGKKELMAKLAPLGSVYQAGTLSGNALATAAGIAALRKIFSTNPYGELEERTAWFSDEMVSILRKRWPVNLRQVGSLFWFQFDELSESFPPTLTPQSCQRFGDFFRWALDKGVYFPPSPYEVAFLSTAHTYEQLEGVLERLQ